MVLSWPLLSSAWPVPPASSTLASGSCNSALGRGSCMAVAEEKPQKKYKRKQRLGLTHGCCCVLGLLSFLHHTSDKVNQSIDSYPVLCHGWKSAQPRHSCVRLVFVCLRIISYVTSLGAPGEGEALASTTISPNSFSHSIPGDCSWSGFLETCFASLFSCDGLSLCSRCDLCARDNRRSPS